MTQRFASRAAGKRSHPGRSCRSGREPPVEIELTTYALRGRRVTAPTARAAHTTAARALSDLGEHGPSCQKSCQTWPRSLVSDRNIDHRTMSCTALWMPTLLAARCSTCRAVRCPVHLGDGRASANRGEGSTAARSPLLEGRGLAGDAATYRERHLQNRVAGRRRRVLGDGDSGDPPLRAGWCRRMVTICLAIRL